MKRQTDRLIKSWQSRIGIYGIILLAIIVTIFQSCNKNDFDFSKMTTPDWSPTWTIPLIHSELTLRDILKQDTNQFIIEDPVSHMLTLEYAASLFSQTAQQYLVIPDQKNIKMESSTLMINVPPLDTSTYEITVPYSFTPAQEGQRLDSLFIKSASIEINILSYINHSGKVSITIPNATKNGQIFQTLISLNYTGTLPVEKTINLDFSGYKMFLDNTTGHTNEITATSIIEVYGDANPDLSPYTFKATCDIINIKFSKIFGYLGQYEYPLTDTLMLNLFKNNIQGSIQLEEIDLFLTTINSVGMPLELEIMNLSAYSAANPPHTVDITDNPLFPNPLTVNSPDVYHVGESDSSNFQFGDNNSQIIDAINMAPEYIYFNILGKSNPANNPAYENFVLDTSRFAVDVKVVLPLFGSIGGFFIEDTVKFDFNIPDQAKMLEFKVRTVNHFPLDAEIQIYFADQNYKVLDSLFSGKDHHILVAAPVSGPPAYRVIESPPIQPFIFSPDPFLEADLQRLKQARFLLIKAKMSTYNSDLVKIYADYMLDVKLAAKIQLDAQN